MELCEGGNILRKLNFFRRVVNLQVINVVGGEKKSQMYEKEYLEENSETVWTDFTIFENLQVFPS